MYTIVPYEQLFQNLQEVTAPVELVYLGQRVLATPLPGPGEFRLIQLLSSSPELFLHPDFQPGTIIRFPAVQKDVQ
ncbi:MAG: YlzJ-like family protein [Bacillota bacterium]